MIKKHMFSFRFDMKDLGEASYVVGTQILNDKLKDFSVCLKEHIVIEC